MAPESIFSKWSSPLRRQKKERAESGPKLVFLETRKCNPGKQTWSEGQTKNEQFKIIKRTNCCSISATFAICTDAPASCSSYFVATRENQNQTQTIEKWIFGSETREKQLISWLISVKMYQSRDLFLGCPLSLLGRKGPLFGFQSQFLRSLLLCRRFLFLYEILTFEWRFEWIWCKSKRKYSHWMNIKKFILF